MHTLNFNCALLILLWNPKCIRVTRGLFALFAQKCTPELADGYRSFNFDIIYLYQMLISSISEVNLLYRMSISKFESSISYDNIKVWMFDTVFILYFFVWYHNEPMITYVQADCSTTTKIPPHMESAVKRRHCSKKKTIIPSSTTWASTSSTSSACFRTFKTATKWLQKQTSMIMSAIAQWSLMGPRIQDKPFLKGAPGLYWDVCCFLSVLHCDRQDDPLTAGAMDTYYKNALLNYADVPYKNFHD